MNQEKDAQEFEHAPAVEAAQQSWLARSTTLRETARFLTFDEPTSRVRAWARTTGGVVGLLLTLQILTGVLLTFYYVPTVDSAHTTVAYIEKIVPDGAWIRALHHYGSQWLTLALALHLMQMFWQASYRNKTVAWLATIALLALTLASGATGYSLAWDARSFFSTRIAEGIAGALPFVGATAREWLLGGAEISTLTLSRFYAMHAVVLFGLLLITIGARLFIFRQSATQGLDIKDQRAVEALMITALVRNALVIGAVFLALAWYAAKYTAPLGPPADAVSPEYLPRPGAQFLWLFQLLKYLPGSLASIVAVTLPFAIFAGLAALPFVEKIKARGDKTYPARRLSSTLFVLGCTLIAALTIAAYADDARDPRVREQLARQRVAEIEFRRAPFTPQQAGANESNAESLEDVSNADTRRTINQTPRENQSAAARISETSVSLNERRVSSAPPEAYESNCASCHGSRGQGVKPFPKLINISSKPRRTLDDIIAILNDPAAYNLHEPMESFADTLTENDKRRIAEWVVALKRKR